MIYFHLTQGLAKYGLLYILQMKFYQSTAALVYLMFCCYTSAAEMFCFVFQKKKNVKALVAQLCPTLCDLMDCSPRGTSVHGDSPGQNTGVGGCHNQVLHIKLYKGLWVSSSSGHEVCWHFMALSDTGQLTRKLIFPGVIFS